MSVANQSMAAFAANCALLTSECLAAGARMGHQDAVSRCQQFRTRQRNAGGWFSAPLAVILTGEDGVADQLETFLTADRARRARVVEEPLFFRIPADAHIATAVLDEHLLLFVAIGQRIQRHILRAFHVGKSGNSCFLTSRWSLDTCAAITLQVELIAAGTEERAAGVDTVVRAPAVVAPTLVHVRTLTLIRVADLESRMTRAAERTGSVGANVSALAISLTALVDIGAVVALGDVAFTALAAEGSDQVDAASLTGIGQAFVVVDTAIAFQLVAFVALAVVSARQVDAAATALVVLALVDILTASIAQLIARVTDALVRAGQIHARSVAWIILTLVYIDTFVTAQFVAVFALASVGALRVDALAAARVDCTFVNVLTDVIDELVTKRTEAAV